MSYFTQMAGLAFHNFASAATGIILAIAFIRGIARRQMNTLGNFWVDFVRCCLWVLLPFCVVGALFLVSQGVVQNLKPYDTVKLNRPQGVAHGGLTGAGGSDWKPVMDTVTTQTIRRTKWLCGVSKFGTNGGGFFAQMSALVQAPLLWRIYSGCLHFCHRSWADVHHGPDDRISRTAGRSGRRWHTVSRQRDDHILGGGAGNLLISPPWRTCSVTQSGGNEEAGVRTGITTRHCLRP